MEEGHERLHSSLVATEALHEFSGLGYAAVDLKDERQAESVISVLAPLVETGVIMWEWGSD